MFNIPSGAVGSQFLLPVFVSHLPVYFTIRKYFKQKYLYRKRITFLFLNFLWCKQFCSMCFLHRLGEYIRRKIFYYKCRKRISFNIIRSIYIQVRKNDGFKSFGMCCRILGVVVINLANGGFDMSIKLSGEGAILLSAAAYALSSGMIKNILKMKTLWFLAVISSFRRYYSCRCRNSNRR